MNIAFLVVVSRVVGWWARRERPRLLVQWAIRLYCSAVKPDLSEIEYPLSEYPSVAAFFVRRLKSGSRPIEDGIVSPVDGTLRSCVPVTEGSALQIKGIRYRIDELLGDERIAKKFEGGSAWHFYLSPRDYHLVHAPCEGKLVSAIHLGGTLWPVNNWSVTRVRGLYTKNERVVLYLETAYGLVALVLVGALNVGSIHLPFDREFTSAHTTLGGDRRVRRDYSPAHQIEKGDHIGTFALGSSVVLLVPWRCEWPSSEEQKVRMGTSLHHSRDFCYTPRSTDF